MTDFIAMMFNCIVSGFAWFTQTFVAAGLMDIMSGLAIISLVFYRIISPMLRLAGSDRARRRSGKDNSDG